MKKRRYPLLPTLAVAALMLIPIRGAAQVFNPYSVSYTATYSNDNLTIGTDTLDGVVYSTVSYNDLYNDGEPGMPSLPVDFLKFSVPYNATDFTVSVNTRMWHTQTLDHLLYPCQMPRLLDGSPAPPAMLPDSATYYSGNYYPSQMAWVVDEGFLAGENHIVTVAVLPFRYTHNASTNQLSMVRRCGITLRYRLSDSLAMQPIVRNDSLLREEGYNLVQTMVVNPNSVKSYAPTLNTSLIDSIGYMHGIGGDVINGGGYAGGDGPGPVNPSLPDPGVDTTGISDELHLMETGVRFPYLIVTTSELKHAVRRIAALKRQKGYNVKVVTMDEVLSSQLSGFGDVVGEGHNARLTYTDEAGKLRQFIRNYYKYFGTDYVLLVGKDIPYRMHDCDFITNGHGDLYYSELHADWSDSSKIEFSPEVYVGRLLCSTPEQINNYTDKLLRYELNPGNGDATYLRRALFTEGRDFCHKLNDLINLAKSFFPDQVIMRDSIESDYPKGCDIIDTINTVQFGFMCSHNHGSPSCIRTYGPDPSDNKRFFLWAIDSVRVLYSLIDSLEVTNGLNRINNKYNPMIYYSLACQTMPYNRVAYADVDINFGESFTMGKDYGGVVYLGYTANNWSSDPKYLFNGFLDQLELRHFKVGMAEALSKNNYKNYCLESTCVYHNLLGDPSLEIWTQALQEYGNINISRTNNTIDISGINSFPSYIAYSKSNGGIGLKSVITRNCSITDASLNGSMMVFSHTRIPYIAPLYLQNTIMSNSEYVIASDVIAGNFVEYYREEGDVTIQSGAVYEIEAKGSVTLQDGFKVEKGATFAVYPSCF